MMKITKTMLVGMLSLGLVASGVSAASAASAPASTERGDRVSKSHERPLRR
jgi:hypothetical protein